MCGGGVEFNWRSAVPKIWNKSGQMLIFEWAVIVDLTFKSCIQRQKVVTNAAIWCDAQPNLNSALPYF